MTTPHRYARTPDQRITHLAERWPAGALITIGDDLRGVIVQAADDIAARWNDGRPGHVALMRLRDQPDTYGGLIYARWEHGDASWARVDELRLIDRDGVYRIWEDSPGRAPVHRLAIRDGDEPTWWAATALPTEWGWVTRDDEQSMAALGAAADHSGAMA